MHFFKATFFHAAAHTHSEWSSTFNALLEFAPYFAKDIGNREWVEGDDGKHGDIPSLERI